MRKKLIDLININIKAIPPIYYLLVVMFLIFVITRIFFKQDDERLRLKKTETVIVIGKVTSEHGSIKSTGHSLEYSFNYEGKEIDLNRKTITNVLSSPYRFVDKYFPVVVSIEDREENVMLITPKDFRTFDLTFPDSLKWVVEWVVKDEEKLIDSIPS